MIWEGLYQISHKLKEKVMFSMRTLLGYRMIPKEKMTGFLKNLRNTSKYIIQLALKSLTYLLLVWEKEKIILIHGSNKNALQLLEQFNIYQDVQKKQPLQTYWITT
jgi:hypothetical protein